MKKRILSILCLIVMLVGLMLPTIPTTCNEFIEVKEEINIPIVTYQEKIIKEVIIKETAVKKIKTNPVLLAKEKMEEELLAIENIIDDKEWFLAYKDILFRYAEWVEVPVTIYDVFTEDELDLLFRVVQAEVGDEWGFTQKTNVASVIFNRLYSEKDNFKYQDTLSKVLVEDEFSTISDKRYKDVQISELTILACEYAFMIEDTTDGCMAFRSDYDPPKKWCKWKRIFSDGAHWFYK